MSPLPLAGADKSNVLSCCDVINTADCIIDLGPEGGDAGKFTQPAHKTFGGEKACPRD